MKLLPVMLWMIFFLGLFIVSPSFNIKTSDEESVECVDIYKQPAFEHDLLKNHKIQKRPSHIPIERKHISKWETREAHVSTWKCPRGTIPIRKYERTNSTDESSASLIGGSPHEHAVGTTVTSTKMYGAKATISVWEPTVERRDEFSLSQIWITSGSYDENNLNSIEVGWQVLSNLYQDSKPRLFIFWTSDTYNVTGCYNLRCPGFIQTSDTIVIGGSITPVSAFEGDQFEITISVWKDQKSGNWWLSLGSNHSLVGYWPAPIFANLTYADDVQWGGEIVNSNISGRHTTTQMGSGHFPDEGFGRVGYIRNLEIVENNEFQPVEDIKVIATDPKFYTIKNMTGDDWGTYLFYGGSGFSQIHSGGSSLALSSFFYYFSFIIFFII